MYVYKLSGVHSVVDVVLSTGCRVDAKLHLMAVLFDALQAAEKVRLTEKDNAMFIARRLELADIEFKKKDFSAELDEFVREHIKLDGVFVLKMLTVHAGMLMCTEVVDNMWDSFLREQGKNEDSKERTPSVTPGGGFDFVGGRRKMSVLVPLVSREDHHEYMRPPSTYK
uniref:Band_3_cyto domain-containing protein n=1 Tax=Ascaris lumbricoides TaxID=6252 RepID=A0A0M3ILQ5_ASCLU